MLLAGRDNASFHFSSRAMNPAQRVPALQDVFNNVIRLDIETDAEHPVEIVVHATPGFRRTKMVTPLTAKITRPAHMLRDNDDTVCLMLKSRGHLTLNQCGRTAAPGIDGGLLMLFRETGTLECTDLTYVAVRMPFAALAAHTKDVEAAAVRSIPHDVEALHLLRAYLDNLPDKISSPQLGRLAATHIYDLIALAIGTARDYKDIASQRGLRAARIDAIKADLTKNPSLSLDQLAVRQRVSARYIQMLLDEAGTSFSTFVLERRLDASHSMLISPRYEKWTIAAIALESGFGDLSHFNRRFKQRFLMTPTDLRTKKAGS